MVISVSSITKSLQFFMCVLFLYSTRPLKTFELKDVEFLNIESQEGVFVIKDEKFELATFYGEGLTDFELLKDGRTIKTNAWFLTHKFKKVNTLLYTFSLEDSGEITLGKYSINFKFNKVPFRVEFTLSIIKSSIPCSIKPILKNKEGVCLQFELEKPMDISSISRCYTFGYKEVEVNNIYSSCEITDKIMAFVQFKCKFLKKNEKLYEVKLLGCKKEWYDIFDAMKIIISCRVNGKEVVLASNEKILAMRV
jgi:hypothetical protein